MSSQIIWTIFALDCYPQEDGKTDVVVTAHWKCSGTQVESKTLYNGSVYSTTSFTFNPNAPFTPYADLTESQVLSWVWANGVNRIEVEESVQQQINAQINPTIITPPLPWRQI